MQIGAREVYHVIQTIQKKLKVPRPSEQLNEPTASIERFEKLWQRNFIYRGGFTEKFWILFSCKSITLLAFLLFFIK